MEERKWKKTKKNEEIVKLQNIKKENKQIDKEILKT